MIHDQLRAEARCEQPEADADEHVYAAEPIQLDVTDPASVTAAAAEISDVTVVINNAGAANRSSLLADDLTDARALFETNFWGALTVTNAFAPALRANRGTVLNVLSVLSWLAIGDAYSATKAALWSATNTQRIKLAPDGVHVAALHLGYADTPMARDVDAPKLAADDVVRAAYDGIETGELEILADEISRQVKAGLAGPIEGLYPQLDRAST
ncbi:SDR family NAD(P)-dependent oxidoreductase [Kutzneria kofuensis]|uniref:NAD(P)-dependent dehydrogenase (Short-subunit alcohol dehydrogenase family) n=1 Tax=Kutzneria kofuensis TaxID=103725 RepID=A0A7W9KLV1_9PSEU|nr:SDR family NAD(P)-dependent oxidoreductase [Kutzneria kofuensis]MBB5894852.1 NAD(P)-dependent dehydrogenase (short-subunit alcohol dehydrogenase family) [Kutzneria kofuensis]